MSGNMFNFTKAIQDVNKGKTPYREVLEYRNSEESYLFHRAPLITQMPRKALDENTRKRVIQYLNKPEFQHGTCFMGNPVNAFTGEIMKDAMITRHNDGVWGWRGELLVYFRDYDIELPQEFIDHVNKFFDDGNEIYDVYLTNEEIDLIMEMRKNKPKLWERRVPRDPNLLQ